MPQVSCRICKHKFFVKPCHIRLGYGKYCSRACQSRGQLRGKSVVCDSCGKTVWRMPKDLKHSKSGKFFCSKSCQTLWRNRLYSGPNHPLWAGGEKTYRERLVRTGIPQICARCQYRDSRALVAHHRDSDRKHNDTKNLMWLCLNCHHLVHRHRELIG